MLLERKNTSQITLMKRKICIESRGKLRKLLFYEKDKLSIALMKKLRHYKGGFWVSKFNIEARESKGKHLCKSYSNYVSSNR